MVKLRPKRPSPKSNYRRKPVVTHKRQPSVVGFVAVDAPLRVSRMLPPTHRDYYVYPNYPVRGRGARRVRAAWFDGDRAPLMAPYRLSHRRIIARRGGQQRYRRAAVGSRRNPIVIE